MQRLPPEVLHQIGLYLDPSSCLACTSVLRDWRDTFLPSFWRVVDGREQPWKALLSLFPTSELTRFFVEHKLWIRDLAITDVSVLYAALGANLTDLTSLSLVCRLTDYSEHDLDVPLPDDLGELVPLAAFSPYIHPGFDRTRVFWRLVLSNPGLRRLIISINSDLMEFADLHMSLSLPPATESFLHSVFTNLHAVRHLEVGLGADDYLLANLATQFPSLESFSYWGLDFVKSQSLTTLPHLNLRTLTLRTAIRPRLRSIFTAFPVLLSLTITGTESYQCDNDDNDDNYDNYDNYDNDGNDDNDDGFSDTWDLAEEDDLEGNIVSTKGGYLEQSHLQTLVIWELSLIVNARVRCPSVRTLKYASTGLSTADSIQKALVFFPALEHVECTRTHLTEPPAPLHPSAKTTTDSLTALFSFSWYRLARNPLIPRVSHISTLILWWIDATVLEAITSTCVGLVYSQFHLKEKCSAGLCQFLATFSQLKECLGDGHLVLAEDIISGPNWTCMELEKLDIEVQVLSRPPTWADMRILDQIRRFGRSSHRKKTNALKQQQASHSVQRQVHAKLARLRNLKHISFGPCYIINSEPYHDGNASRFSPDWKRDRIKCGLDFTQESGFAQVESLPSLKNIEFRTFCITRSGADLQQEWLKERWDMLETWQDQVFTVVARRLA
ncbi:hypothetical protein BKA57DRAFT_436126 [Linnemannia elongata]|nr:hypothetical protein BKA57DRAFT_436126 [Linnemannia elongata]